MVCDLLGPTIAWTPNKNSRVEGSGPIWNNRRVGDMAWKHNRRNETKKNKKAFAFTSQPETKEWTVNHNVPSANNTGQNMSLFINPERPFWTILGIDFLLLQTFSSSQHPVSYSPVINYNPHWKASKT